MTTPITLSEQNAAGMHQACQGLVSAADAACTTLSKWYVEQARRAADPSLSGDRQAAGPLGNIAEISGVSDPPDGTHADEIASYLRAVDKHLSNDAMYMGDAIEGWNLVFNYQEQVVGAFGGGNVHLPRSSKSWSSTDEVELSDPDVQQVSDAARTLNRLAVDAHRGLNHLVRKVHEGVDIQVENEWSSTVDQHFKFIGWQTDMATPSTDADHLRSCAAWCYEAANLLVPAQQAPLKSAAEAIDDLASKRDRCQATCTDLIAMCERS